MLKEDLVSACAELFDVHPRDLTGNYRYAFITRARYALFLALRQRGWSYPRIGRLFKRDHSTVIYGISRALYYCERDPDYADKVRVLKDLMPERVEIVEVEGTEGSYDDGYLHD